MHAACDLICPSRRQGPARPRPRPRWSWTRVRDNPQRTSDPRQSASRTELSHVQTASPLYHGIDERLRSIRVTQPRDSKPTFPLRSSRRCFVEPRARAASRRLKLRKDAGRRDAARTGAGKAKCRPHAVSHLVLPVPVLCSGRIVAEARRPGAEQSEEPSAPEVEGGGPLAGGAPSAGGAQGGRG